MRAYSEGSEGAKKGECMVPLTAHIATEGFNHWTVCFTFSGGFFYQRTTVRRISSALLFLPRFTGFTGQTRESINSIDRLQVEIKAFHEHLSRTQEEDTDDEKVELSPLLDHF